MKSTVLLSIIALSPILLGRCGRDEPRTDTTLVFPSAESLRSGTADGTDFLVHFRVDPTSAQGLYLANFNSEYHFFSENTLSPIGSDPRIKSIDLLTHVWGDSLRLGTNSIPRGPVARLSSESTLLDAPAMRAITNVRFESVAVARQLLREWAEAGKILLAEPNYHSEPTESYEQYLTRIKDKLDDWHRAINIEQALTYLQSQGNAPVSPVIAVMDSGVDNNHRLLKEQMWENDRVGQADCLNDLYGCNTTVGVKGILGNGDTGPYRIDASGRCPVSSTGQCARDCCHGSHVAGIVAAYSARETVDRPGVCPMCKIMAIRVVGKSPTGGGDEGTILDSSIIRGLKYISRFYTEDGNFLVRVINASFGKFQRSRTVSLLIKLMRNTANGSLVIAAAGNEDTMKRNYPAGYADVLAVSNIYSTLVKQKRSNFGNWVEIAAPGSDIFSTIPGPENADIEKKSGTSMAAPVVAGVAGLLLSFNPTISFDDLRDRLIRTSNQNIVYSNDVNRLYFPKIPGANSQIALLGAGLVDAEAVVKKEIRAVPINEAANRVTTSCSRVGAGVPAATRWYLALLPLLIAWLSAPRRKDRRH